MVIINLIAVIGFLASVAYVIRKQTAYFPFFAFLSIAHLWGLVSCFYNDLGIYNLELFRFTETTLATTRLALFYIVFNLGFLVAAALLGKRPLARRDYGIVGGLPQLGYFKFLMAVGVVALVGYDAYSLVTNGMPLLTGVDRETFTAKAGFVNVMVVSWGPWIAFFLGMTRRQGRRFHVQTLLVALMVIHTILTGHKFSLPSTLLVFYYLPIIMRYVHRHPDWNPLRPRYLLRVVAVCVLFGSVVFATYTKTDNNEIAIFFLKDRLLALQGEIWWAVDKDLTETGTYDQHHWQDELTYLTSRTEVPPEKVGMRYLMIKILGPERAYAVFDSGYLYTMAYPAILLAMFPFVIGLIIQLLAGAFILVLLYYLRYCIIYNHKLRAMLSLLVLFPFASVLATGNFFFFLTLGMAVKIGTLICLEGVPSGALHWPQMAQSASRAQPELGPNTTNSTSFFRRL